MNSLLRIFTVKLASSWFYSLYKSVQNNRYPWWGHCDALVHQSLSNLVNSLFASLSLSSVLMCFKCPIIHLVCVYTSGVFLNRRRKSWRRRGQRCGGQEHLQDEGVRGGAPQTRVYIRPSRSGYIAQSATSASSLLILLLGLNTFSCAPGPPCWGDYYCRVQWSSGLCRRHTQVVSVLGSEIKAPAVWNCDHCVGLSSFVWVSFFI